MLKKIIGLPLAAASTLAVVSCASPGESAEATSHTVENCGNTWSFDADPGRVVAMSDTVPATLDALGVFDRLVAKAGAFNAGYYPEALNSKLAEVPSISDRLDTTGHLQLSMEDVLDAEPDLVVGFSDTVNPQTMTSVGVPVVEEPSWCGTAARAVGFDDVYAHVGFYGDVFDRQDQAETYVEQLTQQVAAQKSYAAGQGRTVAVLYPTVGGGATYAYGKHSMATAVVEAAGLRSVFDDVKDRVFEVSVEQLVELNPDVIIAAYSNGSGENAAAEVEGLTGADSVAAVQNGQVLPMLINHLDPPTPLAVDGLVELNNLLREEA